MEVQRPVRARFIKTTIRVAPAWGPFNLTVAVTSRGFVPGKDGHWVEERRQRARRLG